MVALCSPLFSAPVQIASISANFDGIVPTL
jgi:hypothetical protein